MTKTIQVLTTEERHAILASMIPTHEQGTKRFKMIRNRTMVMLMLETGVRVGELCQLTAEDLYFQAKPVLQIIIRAEIAKNGNERQIPVSTLLSLTLTEYWKCCKSYFEHVLDWPAFFHPSRHTPLTPRQVERIVRAAALKAIGREAHPHMLRHTFATRMMRVAPPSVVQDLLGHKNPETTMIYTHPNDADLRDAVTKAEDVTGI